MFDGENVSGNHTIFAEFALLLHSFCFATAQLV